jgi:hypothetical protein
VIVRRHDSFFAFGGDKALCNPGERAVGGGIGRTDNSVSGGDSVAASYPTADGTTPAPEGSTPIGWVAKFETSPPTGTNLTIFVVCVSP